MRSHIHFLEFAGNDQNDHCRGLQIQIVILDDQNRPDAFLLASLTLWQICDIYLPSFYFKSNLSPLPSII